MRIKHTHRNGINPFRSQHYSSFQHVYWVRACGTWCPSCAGNLMRCKSSHDTLSQPYISARLNLGLPRALHVTYVHNWLDNVSTCSCMVHCMVQRVPTSKTNTCNLVPTLYPYMYNSHFQHECSACHGIPPTYSKAETMLIKHYEDTHCTASKPF